MTISITHEHQHVNPPKDDRAEQQRCGKTKRVRSSRWTLKKAYDSIDHEFLQLTLKRTGMGEKFLGFFKKIYDQGEASISIGGNIGNTIKLERGIKQKDPRGIKQGDSISMFLFTLALFTLLQKLNQDLEG